VLGKIQKQIWVQRTKIKQESLIFSKDKIVLGSVVQSSFFASDKEFDKTYEI
jgi:hypothetical protein